MFLETQHIVYLCINSNNKKYRYLLVSPFPSYGQIKNQTAIWDILGNDVTGNTHNDSWMGSTEMTINRSKAGFPRDFNKQLHVLWCSSFVPVCSQKHCRLPNALLAIEQDQTDE